MAPTPFVCGNWKLNHNLAETRDVIREIAKGLTQTNIDVAIAPVVTTLAAACEAAKGTKLKIAAQNVYFESKGAFTGEWSVAHLAELGCSYVIVGHSERRAIFGETDAMIGKKVRAVFDGGLTPIACVGETLDQREAGQTLDVVGRQVSAILEGTEQEQSPRLVIAYEPVWAIGTGKTASAAQAQEIHQAIRRQVAAHMGHTEAAAMRIQYGGSVKADNAAELMAEPDVDGALVGGASLQAAGFLEIVKAAAAR